MRTLSHHVGALLLLGAGAARGLSLGVAAPARPIRWRAAPRLAADAEGLSQPMTVSDAKEAFQAASGRPVNPAAQGFVTNMLSGVCFAFSSPKYAYSRVFAVGYEALCTTFLEAMCPADDAEAIRSSMAAGLGLDPAVLRRDAQALLAAAEGKTEDEVLAIDDLARITAAVSSRPCPARSRPCPAAARARWPHPTPSRRHQQSFKDAEAARSCISSTRADSRQRGAVPARGRGVPMRAFS